MFLWAILSYLDALPGFALRLDIWDLIGTASYTVAFALFESLVVLLAFVLIAAILPPQIFKNHFTALGSSGVVISSLWMMYANYQRIDFSGQDTPRLLLGLALYLVSIGIPCTLITRYKRIELMVQAIILRVAVLGYVYVLLGCLGIVIIFIRNF